MNVQNLIASALIGGSLLTGSVFAVGVHHKMIKNHPRVNQVHHRENRQRNRMNYNLKHGAMTQKQAGQVMKERQQMNQQVKQDRAGDNGHLTKTEQRQINKEENTMNRQIRHDRKVDTGH